jgi:hypothetical protein
MTELLGVHGSSVVIFHTQKYIVEPLCKQPTSGSSSPLSLTRVHSLKALSTPFANLSLCLTKSSV